MSEGEDKSRSGLALIPPPASELKVSNKSFSALTGLGEVMATRTRRASTGHAGRAVLVAAPVFCAGDEPCNVAPGRASATAVIEIPASLAFTTIRSATLCSSESAESYPNRNVGDGVI